MDEHETQRVQEIRKALEQEFATSQERSRTSITDITELKEDALEALRYELRHGMKPDLKARISMWVYEKCLEAENSQSADRLMSLIEDMPASAPVAD